MSKFLKGMGWSLSALGVICGLLAIAVAFDAKEDDTDAFFGFIMIGLFFGVPGALLLWRTSKGDRERAFRNQFVGFLRSHDRFTIAEMAKKIGKTEMETEQLIAHAISEDGIDLVYHRPDGQYMHRNRIRTEYRVFDRCGSCGATLQHEISLEGEMISCPYCGSAVG